MKKRFKGQVSALLIIVYSLSGSNQSLELKRFKFFANFNKILSSFKMNYTIDKFIFRKILLAN